MVPRTPRARHSPQTGVFGDSGLGAEGRSGELEGPGSASCGRVGSRGAGGVPHVGQLACHTVCPAGPSAGVGRAEGWVVEFLSSHPGESGGPPVAAGRELRVGLGALLAVPWPVPRPGASPYTSSSVSCPVPFLSCPTLPLPPVPGWASGVQAWLAAGGPHRRPGPGDEVGLSGPGAAVSVPRAGAVTPVIRASTSPVGLTTSPAGTWPLSDGVSGQKYLSEAHPMPPTGKSGDAGPSLLVTVNVQRDTCLSSRRARGVST